ncbi:hypothetical protein BJ322DRAFT_1111680 [Thelephora terrestris]|uniref:F-box domain-containing protein n=1 Tax=Thelephora terrestris TaxID=56493 RepID=A0A9P6L3L0_9AGAM|nr:hypothetical protein BJ322DRAFT_1111680 [Thelephora terrestris]
MSGFWRRPPSQLSRVLPYVAVPAIADKFPPLRGHLRLVGLEPEAVGLRLADFTRELQKGMNFRSVELEGHLNGRSYTQQILNACASTVTDLTITPHGNGYLGLRYLNFKGIAGLRRLTLRTAFTPVFGVAFGFIPISTITSPVFRQLVLGLGGIPSRFDGPSLRFVEDGDFRFTIRTGKLHDHEAFQKHAKEAFPLLASRGCIYFEISSSIGNRPLSYHPPRLMVKFSQQIRELGRRVGVPLGGHVDLDSISAAIHHGCMGLPQELVDHITNMLCDDVSALQACSLTCKAMFVSTRHLIHQTLCLTPRKNEKILTRKEKHRFWGPRPPDVKLRLLSYMGEHDFLQYTRRVHIRGFSAFNSEVLLPHLRHFQSLDRVHTLVIENYYPSSRPDLPRICFDHFYPTLTSLTLTSPFDHYRALLRFALLFPQLENLAFEWLKNDEWYPLSATAPPIVDKFPPLCGNLRLAFPRSAQWPRALIREIQNGINFRSIELESEYLWDHGHFLLGPCSRSLEEVTIVTNGSTHVTLGNYNIIRRLTYRMPFHQAIVNGPELIYGVIFTITSPVFCEFVLEMSTLPSLFDTPSLEVLGYWGKTDGLLEERFAKHGHFRLIIRMGKHRGLKDFQQHIRGAFPLLEKRGCIHFQISHSIKK